MPNSLQTKPTDSVRRKGSLAERAQVKVTVYLADQNPHRDRSRGISEMTLWLLSLLRNRPELSLSTVTSRSSLRVPELKSTDHQLPLRTDRMTGRLLADALHPWISRHGTDVWFYPKGYVSPMSRPRAPMVGMMHDTIVQHYADHYPGFRSQRDLNYWLHLTKASLRSLDLVLTVSEHAKGQLVAFCERHRINPPEIVVTYEGTIWEGYQSRSFVKGGYAIHLASASPHKRTNWLLETWLGFQKVGIDLPELRLVGGLDIHGQRTLSQLRGVQLLPAMSHEELVSQVGEASLFLLPSEIEGFGLPALEAYCVATPVCFVQGTSVDEVVGKEAEGGGFSLSDVDSLRKAIDWANRLEPVQVQNIRQAMLSQFNGQRIAARVADQLSAVAG